MVGTDLLGVKWKYILAFCFTKGGISRLSTGTTVPGDSSCTGKEGDCSDGWLRLPNRLFGLNPKTGTSRGVGLTTGPVWYTLPEHKQIDSNLRSKKKKNSK